MSTLDALAWVLAAAGIITLVLVEYRRPRP